MYCQVKTAVFCCILGICCGRLGYLGMVEYREGDTGLVLTVPHGAGWDYHPIPDRRYGVLEGDDHTRELGEVVAASICHYLGKCPHVIFCNLKRSKLDANRNISVAAQGNPEAEKVWNDYHGFIEEAKRVEGEGVVIDLHGQSHLQNSTELGYLLSTRDLNTGNYEEERSSIKHLARRLGTRGKEIITGLHSLGAYLEREGYKALPSPRQTSPGPDQYFTVSLGGFTVETHGSRDRGRFDAIL